jgi:hypothetical protein
MTPGFREEVYAGAVDEAVFVNSLLESEGITTDVVGLYHPRMLNRLRTIYVLNEAQVAQAREIVARFRRGEGVAPPTSYRSWRCATCNELIEGQFAVCWKCGRPKRDE